MRMCVSPWSTRAVCAMMPGLCSVGWRLTSSTSPSQVAVHLLRQRSSRAGRRRRRRRRRFRALRALTAFPAGVPAAAADAAPVAVASALTRSVSRWRLDARR